MMSRLLAALGVTHMISEYGFELTLCEGPSMMPTILPQGEIIVVDRFTPQLHSQNNNNNKWNKQQEQQQPWSGAARAQQARYKQEKLQQKDDDIGVVWWHEPRIPVGVPASKRMPWIRRFWQQCTTPLSVGDVVVVQHPDRRGTVCKRILGMPGDIVVNPPKSILQRRRRRRRQQQRKQPDRQRRPDASSSSLFVLPDGHVWLEGDNALNSSDSRNYGPVPAALIVGRVVCRIWPLRGHAWMERGQPPAASTGDRYHHPAAEHTIILPAGYEGEEIIKTWEQWEEQQKKQKKQKK